MSISPELLARIEAAAQEVWEENPQIQAQYRDFAAYLAYHRSMLEWRGEWAANPGLRQEFGGDFLAFVAYRRHEAAGHIKIIGER
jgi:hypothetical protein